MFRRIAFVLVVFFVLSARALVQSPSPSQIATDPKLTESFLKDDQSNRGALAYHEVIGLMTRALRGEDFGYYEQTILAKAKKGGGDNKGEFSRMLLEMRNLSLRVADLEKQKKQ